MAGHASPQGTEASCSWNRAAVILEPLRWLESICQLSTVCGRHARQGEGRCSAEKYAAVSRSGIRGRPWRAKERPFILTAILDKMRAGVFQAWCRRRSNWCWLILMLCIGEGQLWPKMS